MQQAHTNLAEQIVATVGVALIAVGPDGRVIFSNPAATQLFGHSPDEFAALHVSDLLGFVAQIG